MSQIQVDRIINNAGTGAPTCSNGLVVSTASTVGYALTVTGDLNVTGTTIFSRGLVVSTASTVGYAMTVTGNLNVTGTIPKSVAFSIAFGS